MKASVIRNTCSSLRVPAAHPGSRVTGLLRRCTPIVPVILRTASTTLSDGTKPKTVINFGKLSSNYAGFDSDRSVRYRKNNTGYNVSLNHCSSYPYGWSDHALCFFYLIKGIDDGQLRRFFLANGLFGLSIVGHLPADVTFYFIDKRMLENCGPANVWQTAASIGTCCGVMFCQNLSFST